MVCEIRWIFKPLSIWFGINRSEYQCCNIAKTTKMKRFVKLAEYSNHESTWENTKRIKNSFNNKRIKTLLQVFESALSWMISCNTPQGLNTGSLSIAHKSIAHLVKTPDNCSHDHCPLRKASAALTIAHWRFTTPVNCSPIIGQLPT